MIVYMHESVHGSATRRLGEGVRPPGGGVTVPINPGALGTLFRSYARRVLVVNC